MRSYYSEKINNFLNQDEDEILGILTSNSEGDVSTNQVYAWREQIKTLQDEFQKLFNKDNFFSQIALSNMHIFFEFKIPRMGSRIDVVLFVPTEKPHLILLEYKVGESDIKLTDKEQVMDYALELKNFHLGSHKAEIYPILVGTEYKGEIINLKPIEGIAEVSCVNSISNILEKIEFNYQEKNASEWERSPYEPTPTIIEAARALWRNQDVKEITRSEAGALNIIETTNEIEELIKEAKEKQQKKIIFVTGVPGAGKTLVGLNIASSTRQNSDHAVFLSGNWPLVSVLQESLARDEVKRNGGTKEKAKQKVKSFIQIIHHYRDESLINDGPPHEHIAIFDEAQRLWNEHTLTDFMWRKKGVKNYDKSEGGALLEYLDRHPDWAVCICLVGGGQEINKGEAGIQPWLDAVSEINAKEKKWQVYISPNIKDVSEYKVTDFPKGVIEKNFLHLAVSMRSFRSEEVSNFVKTLLDIEETKLPENYPIVITRSLSAAKNWVRKKARGSERYGLLASSKALRLKPYAIDMKSTSDPVHYFLDGKDDTRSSFYLESAASEFEVQGLELDWTVVCWDGDFRMIKMNNRYPDEFLDWECKDFKGNKWIAYNNTELEPNRQDFLKNAYRVLLTRARQGMVIFVPRGMQVDENGNYPDPTRKPEFYDGTYNYLKSLGILEIGEDIIDNGY